MARIGVLALQGGYAAHAAMLTALGHDPVEVRDPGPFGGAGAHLDGLCFPGGESTTQLRLIARFGLRAALDDFIASGRPVLATCAGLVLAAARVSNPEQPSFGWLDVTVVRNGWGRQLDSFEDVADVGDGGALPLTFIRAPRITDVGQGVEVLAELRGEPILVRQRNVTGATFHPELTGDVRVHRWVFGRGGGRTRGVGGSRFARFARFDGASASAGGSSGNGNHPRPRALDGAG
jgi:5'-phosphate synthase pdxT subunit